MTATLPPPAPRPVEKASDKPAGKAPEKAGSSWRERLQAGPPPEPELPPDPLDRSARASRPARPKASADPVDGFRRALSARMRGHVEHGLLRRESDGVLVLLPPDRELVREHVEEHRFHVMAAAAEAFGRPVPVRVAIEPNLIDEEAAPGDIEGSELLARRLTAKADRSSLVQAVRGRFDARIVTVVPSDLATPTDRT